LLRSNLRVAGAIAVEAVPAEEALKTRCRVTEDAATGPAASQNIPDQRRDPRD